MNIFNPAALSCAIFVSIYWFIVFLKVIIITPKLGKMPNVIPKDWLGFVSRLLMLPLIIAWIALSWRAGYTLPPWSSGFAWLGSVIALFALLATIYCWYYMGQAWRIGIDPKECNALLTTGPFHYIRHPIYSLSMLLMLGCTLACQTSIMMSILCAHCLLFYTEARREEHHLLRLQGDAYQRYVAQTQRFFSRKLVSCWMK